MPDDMWLIITCLICGAAMWFIGRHIWWGSGPMFCLLLSLTSASTANGQQLIYVGYANITAYYGSDLVGRLTYPSYTDANHNANPEKWTLGDVFAIYQSPSVLLQNPWQVPSASSSPQQGTNPVSDGYELNTKAFTGTGNTYQNYNNIPLNEDTTTGIVSGVFQLGATPAVTVVNSNTPTGTLTRTEYQSIETITITYVPGSNNLSITGPGISDTVYFTGYAGATDIQQIVFQGVDAAASAPSPAFSSEYSVSGTNPNFTFLWDVPTWSGNGNNITGIGNITLVATTPFGNASTTTQPTSQATTQATTAPYDFQQAATLLTNSSSTPTDDNLLGCGINHHKDQILPFMPSVTFSSVSVPTTGAGAQTMIDSICGLLTEAGTGNWTAAANNGSTGTTTNIGLGENAIAQYIFAGIDCLNSSSPITVGGTGILGVTMQNPLPGLMTWIRTVTSIGIPWYTFKHIWRNFFSSIGMRHAGEAVPPLQIGGEFRP